MNFTDFGFWPRLLCCLLAIAGVKWACGRFGIRLPGWFDRAGLASTSLYLLSCVDALTFWLFILLTVVSYTGVLIISSTPTAKRTLVLFFAVPLVLLPLAYFKYRTFLIEEVLGWSTQTFDAVGIPAGISFYTFQKVSVLVDAARLPRFRPSFLNYLNFASFFPQVVAGPIERKDELMPQVERFQFSFSLLNLNNASSWLALGVFYKICLADNLSPFIDRELWDSAWPIVWNTLLFGFKIYFDFCGYSLIALGLGKLVGVDLLLNFRSPYLCTSILDFWRRWHVTLSYWFRDYVYIPLGGSRTRYWAGALMLVFLLSGLWHGASWTFVLWGAMHGAYCVIGHALKGKFALPPALGWIFTMSLVFIAWLPFYETRWNILCQKFCVLASWQAYSLSALRAYVGSFDPGSLATMTVAVAMCMGALSLEFLSAQKRSFYAFASHPPVIFLLVVATIWLGSSRGNAFVYFQF